MSKIKNWIEHTIFWTVCWLTSALAFLLWPVFGIERMQVWFPSYLMAVLPSVYIQPGLDHPKAAGAATMGCWLAIGSIFLIAMQAACFHWWLFEYGSGLLLPNSFLCFPFHRCHKPSCLPLL